MVVEVLKKVPYGGAERRMHQIGSQIIQGCQNKSTMMQPRVGKSQKLGISNFAFIK